MRRGFAAPVASAMLLSYGGVALAEPAEVVMDDIGDSRAITVTNDQVYVVNLNFDNPNEATEPGPPYDAEHGVKSEAPEGECTSSSMIVSNGRYIGHATCVDR